MRPEVLVNRVESITSSSASLQQMTESVSRLAKPQATGDIVEAIVQLAKNL